MTSEESGQPEAVRKKLAVIGCGVFEWNLQKVREQVGTEYQLIVHILPARLHNNPQRLRELIQEKIEELDSTAGLEGICLLYGLCGRGTVNLRTRNIPLIIPRVQDCIGFYLGSHQRYLEEFKQHPGTRYMSRGWYEKRIQTPDSESEDYLNLRDKSLYNTSFEQLRQKYGEENARFIHHFRESWKRNYTRAGYIKFPEEKEEDPPGKVVMRGIADDLNWEFRELRGDNGLLEAMFTGHWSHPELLLVPPHSRTVGAPGNAVLGYTTQINIEEAIKKHATTAGNRSQAAVLPAPGLGLGIDTGGTYTDGVIYDFENSTVAGWAKAPTNHSELIQGIREVLSRLPKALLPRVERVAISTTLATNAFLEKKGRKVALLLMSPITIEDHGLHFQFVHRIRGRMSLDGEELEPISESEIKEIAETARQAGCEAFAVSGFGATINPEHEKKVAQLTCEHTGFHSVCGHELSSKLNFFERATTAAMNARLIPLIEELLDSVRKALTEVGLEEVQIMVVKGDGSQILDRVAAKIPVETIMSGPAASLIGAAFLSGVSDGVVADMGGTSLDMALLLNDRPVLTEEGAIIGDFQTCVQAMRIHTSGLGGDSEIDLSAWPRVRIGPRRIEPITRLAARYPEALQQLEHPLQSAASREPHVLEFFELVPGRKPCDSLTAALQTGPLSTLLLADKLERPGPNFLKWQEHESHGNIRRYGLTLTDVMHAEGRLDLYASEGAGHLLDGWANLLGVRIEQLIEQINQEFRRRVIQEIIGTLGYAEQVPWENSVDTDHFPGWLVSHLAAPDKSQSLLSFTLSSTSTLLPVGAPAPLLFPQFEKHLDMPLRICQYSAVVNAVGAIAGNVMLRENASIRLTEDNALLCAWRGGNRRARDLEEALDICKEALHSVLRERAAENRVPFIDPALNIIPHQAATADGEIFLGATVEAEIRLARK